MSQRSSVSSPDEFKVACYVSGMVSELYGHLDLILTTTQKQGITKLVKASVLNYDEIAQELIQIPLYLVPRRES